MKKLRLKQHKIQKNMNRFIRDVTLATFLFIPSIIYAQINISCSKAIGDSTMKLTYRNVDSISHVIWLQDWRLLIVKDLNELNFIGYDPGRNTKNYLFFLSDSIKEPLEFNYFVSAFFRDKVYERSLVVLDPGEEFCVILLVAPPTEKFQDWNTRHAKLYYFYSMAPKDNVISAFPEEENRNLYYTTDQIKVQVPSGLKIQEKFSFYHNNKEIGLKHDSIDHLFRSHLVLIHSY